MHDEQFKKMDESWMKNLKKLREEKTPPALMEGFSVSVKGRILEEETRKALTINPLGSFRRLAPLWVPTFAVLIIASAVVLKSPAGRRPYPAPTVKTAGAVSVNASEVNDEIEALRQMGAWTEDDEDDVAGPLEIIPEDAL